MILLSLLPVLAVIVAACGPAETVEPAPIETLEEESEAAESEPPTASDFDIYGEASEADYTTTDSGLQYYVFEEGDGPTPEEGEVVTVHYTGYLTDGTEFDSSVGTDQPFAFAIGKGSVIPGWDEGIGLLKTGDKGRIILPPELGYGPAGAGGGIIPPNATLIFDVELIDIQPGSPEEFNDVSEDNYTTTESGLKYFDLVEGEGETAESGMQVSVHYTGWLTDGTKFDSSIDRGQPFVFPLGTGNVIAGWDDGVQGMKVGGIRQLNIPSELAYGESGAGSGTIPPNATLVFEIELLEVQ
jgi:peptidylprolyl isomerase